MGIDMHPAADHQATSRTAIQMGSCAHPNRTRGTVPPYPCPMYRRIGGAVCDPWARASVVRAPAKAGFVAPDARDRLEVAAGGVGSRCASRPHVLSCRVVRDAFHAVARLPLAIFRRSETVLKECATHTAQASTAGRPKARDGALCGSRAEGAPRTRMQNSRGDHWAVASRGRQASMAAARVRPSLRVARFARGRVRIIGGGLGRRDANTHARAVARGFGGTR